MAKKCLGIDVGKDQLKLVLMKGETIQKAAVVQMPDGLLQEGRIVSVETAGELIRKTMRENRIHCKEAAVVLSPESCFLRNVTMPEMTAEQLVYNLPYEFRDYITEELKSYVFDYSLGEGQVLPKGKGGNKRKKAETEPEEEEHQGLSLLAAAVSYQVLEDLRLMLRKAGLKLVCAVPKVSACENLLRKKDGGKGEKDQEYGILDLGNSSSHLMIFRGNQHQVTRVVERGMEHVEEMLADEFNIDIHLAHTWLLANHEDCVHSSVCQEAFSQISVELMRALNFYQFSNPDSNLEKIWICGGGASVGAMRQSLEETLPVKLQDASGLLEEMTGNSVEQLGSIWMQAAGAALGRTGKNRVKRINLALAGKKKKHYGVAVASVAAIAAAAGLFGKFGVADRLAEVSVQQALVKELELQKNELTAYVESFGDLQQTYAHYTAEGLTDEELSYIKRPEILDLLETVILPRVKVSSWNLSGNRLTLPVTGENLSDINKLIQELEEKELVDYCSIMAASTEEDEKKQETVTGQLVIYLQRQLTAAEGGTMQ